MSTWTIVILFIFIGVGFIVKEIEINEWRQSFKDKRKRTITKIKKYKEKVKHAI